MFGSKLFKVLSSILQIGSVLLFGVITVFCSPFRAIDWNRFQSFSFASQKAGPKAQCNFGSHRESMHSERSWDFVGKLLNNSWCPRAKTPVFVTEATHRTFTHSEHWCSLTNA